jgi:RNA polymerase sigma factor (sigma-70 family)
MKTLSNIINESKQPLDIQDDTINYISGAELRQYLVIADKFISADTKDVINWLIEHPNYVDDIAGPNADNALATFYNNGVPSTPVMKELYKSLGKVIKNGRMLEIPVFQTKEQFEAILDKTVSPDEIILDLTTEKGRNEIAKKYEPMAWKIARSYVGRSNLDLEELYAIGMEGIVWAMNKYGKKNDKSSASDDDVKAYTFHSWVSYCIRIAILEAIKDQGHLVRVPRSQQSKEKTEKGHMTKNYSISMETPVGRDKDGNSRRLSDKIGDYERAGKSLEDEDNARLWEHIHKLLKKKFDDRTLDIFYDKWGVNGHKKLSGKELMEKYGFNAQSNINFVCSKVINYMMKNPETKEALLELYEFVESRNHDNDMEDNVFETRSLINIGNDED